MAALSLVFLWAPIAKPDKPATPVIPDAPTKVFTPSDAALPSPYEAWAGAAFAPPPQAPDRDSPGAPPPLARPSELPRRPFEVAIALAASLPSCQPGSIDDRRCSTIDPGPSFDATLVYRVSPFFGVGGEASFVGFGQDGGGAFPNTSNAKFVGVLGRVYFADDGPWDPYVSLTLGAGTLETQSLHDSARLRETRTGFGGRIGGGVDVLLGTRVRVGPTASFAHWLAASDQRCVGGVCQSGGLAYGRLVGFATLGLRVTASWGDAS